VDRHEKRLGGTQIICLQNTYRSIAKLTADSRSPTNVSIATFRPREIERFVVEESDRHWKKSWRERLRQFDLFVGDRQGKTRVPIPKVPYRFKYRLVDEEGARSTMSIED
jgi:hypothetical protein